jgi:pimeloyl-ACP methyl ester carboxylesterase
VGSYRLPVTAEPVALTLDVHGRAATVSLGPGHLSATQVGIATHGAGVRFALPGRPALVVFTGALSKGLLSGTVTQGRLRGTFQLRRGVSPVTSALGLYRSAGGAAVAVIKAEGLPAWLVELPGGATHGLNDGLTTVGRLLGETRGDGTLTVAPGGLTWAHGGRSTRYARVRLHQQEIRVGRLAGTLTIPDGPGPFAAAALVHGSGAAGREEFQTFAAYLESSGVAVLATDKRGVGQSGGSFPGPRATETAIGALAADARSQVRFLDSLPQIAATRVGLVGDSQAGWVIARAAAQERAVRWAVTLAGPTTTVGETDSFTQLAGAEQRPPSGTRAQMLAEVRAQGRSGFDPLPSLRGLAIPMLWVYGDDDRNVPTELCVERLQAIKAGHDFTWVVLPMTHALIDLPNGLYSSLRQSRGFNAGLFPAIGDWLRSRAVAG